MGLTVIRCLIINAIERISYRGILYIVVFHLALDSRELIELLTCARLSETLELCTPRRYERSITNKM